MLVPPPGKAGGTPAWGVAVATVLSVLFVVCGLSAVAFVHHRNFLSSMMASSYLIPKDDLKVVSTQPLSDEADVASFWTSVLTHIEYRGTRVTLRPLNVPAAAAAPAPWAASSPVRFARSLRYASSNASESVAGGSVMDGQSASSPKEGPLVGRGDSSSLGPVTSSGRFDTLGREPSLPTGFNLAEAGSKRVARAESGVSGSNEGGARASLGPAPPSAAAPNPQN